MASALGTAEIFNTDPGSRFNCEAITGLLKANSIAISMDGKGRWRDNVFVERLWKSIKYGDVYPRVYDSVAHAEQSIGKHLTFYNTRRPHSGLARMKPDQVYFKPLPLPQGRLNAQAIHLSERASCADERGQL